MTATVKMNFSTLDQQIRVLDDMQEIRYCKLSESNLGPTTSYFIHLSLDNKCNWINGIYHNSRYAIFSLQDGKLELISKHYQMPKFRKSKIKSEVNAAEKIVSYCLSV